MSRQNTFAGLVMVCFSAFGGILFGYDTGVISGVKEMPDWLMTFGHPTGDSTNPYAISSSTESLVVSILSAGTFFGALLGAPVAGMFLSFILSRFSIYILSPSRFHWTKVRHSIRMPRLRCWCCNANRLDSHTTFRKLIDSSASS